MKTLIITLALLSPLAASAAGSTTLVCNEQEQVDYTVVTRFGLQEDSELTIVANGVLHTVIDARIDKVSRPDRGTISVDVTTVNDEDAVTPESGKATIDFAVEPSSDDAALKTAGTAVIHLTKFPPRHPGNIVFRPEYELSGCTGTL